jgi:hypothetical protein
MEVETKFLRLFKPVSIGNRIYGWDVCWIGGWDNRRVVFVDWSIGPGPTDTPSCCYLAGENLTSTAEILPWFLVSRGDRTFLSPSTYASSLDPEVRERGAKRIFRVFPRCLVGESRNKLPSRLLNVTVSKISVVLLTGVLD